MWWVLSFVSSSEVDRAQIVKLEWSLGLGKSTLEGLDKQLYNLKNHFHKPQYYNM